MPNELMRFYPLLREAVSVPQITAAATLVAATMGGFFVPALLFAASNHYDIHTTSPVHVPARRSMWWVAAAVYGISGVLLPFTRDILTFFVMWEMVTIGAGLMLAGERDARRLLAVYVPSQLFAAAFLFSAFGLHYATTASAEIPSDGLLGGPASTTFAFLAVAVKSAMVPLHAWMTRTYSRVHPVTTVVLSAVGTKIGVYALYRLVGPAPALELLGGGLAVIGVVYALRQHELRAFLSFHVVSQVGYMVAGVGSISVAAQAGGLYHLAGNIVYKGLLFMVAACLIRIAGHEHIYAMNGIGRKYRVLFLTGFIGSLAIAGVPPFNGYISKIVLEGNLESGVAVWLLRVAGVGTAASFSKFMWYCFFSRRETERRSKETGTAHARAIRPIHAVLLLAPALMCLVMGIRPHIFFGMLPAQARVTAASFASGLIAPATGVAVFGLLFSRLRPLLERLPTLTAVTGPLRRLICSGLRELQELHSGDIRRYLGWILCGLIALWSALLL